MKKVNKKIEEYNADEFNNIFHYDAELKAVKAYEYEQGIEQGIKQEKFNIAKNMLNNKITIDLIAKITKLDRDYITTL